MSSPSFEAARARLEELRAAGARGQDAPAFDFAATLLAKAESLAGAAGERLLQRAIARTEQLAQELANARARAAARLAGLGAARLPTATSSAWLARLRGEALRRGLRTPHARSERIEAHLLAVALYESSRAEAEATRIAVRAEADLPAEAGPYNPLVLAIGALGELATLSPAYLSALVAELAELAPLLALPPLPPSEARRAPNARRGRRAR